MYEYECENCQKVHEIIQKFSDPLLKTCPECGNKVSKKMSLGAFALKGTGWYTTDYRRKAPQISESSHSGDRKSDESSHEKKDAKGVESSVKSPSSLDSQDSSQLKKTS